MTIKEADQNTWTPEPDPETQRRPDPVPYPAPQPDPTSMAGIEVDAEIDDAPGLEAGTYDEPEVETEPFLGTEVAPETEADDEPDVEAETPDERGFDSDGRPQPDLELHEESDRDLAPDTTATPDEPETLDPPDEVDLRDTPAAAATEGRPSLGDTGVYEERWIAIKASFVDEPRQAVQSADRLVTEAMEDRARVLMSHHDSLQAQWYEDDDVDTERLRAVFQDYRAFLFGPPST